MVNAAVCNTASFSIASSSLAFLIFLFFCFLSMFFLYFFIKTLGLVVPLLLAVAFLTLAERKVIASMQRRKGPNVLGFFGVLQPLCDGLKLFVKEPVLPNSANLSLFLGAPILTFTLAILA